MLIVDANVLLHAVNERAREHDSARAWMATSLRGGEAVGFAWVAILAFLRLSTHPAVFPRPLTADRATEVAEGWLARRSAVVVEPTSRHLPLLGGLLGGSGTAGNLVTDAHLAAVALEHNATIVSFDRDFGRFEGVRWRHPDQE